MAFDKKIEPKPDRWEVTFEDDECIQIWKYNSKKTTSGPIEVETRWKKVYNPWNKKKKTLGDLAKESKKKVSDL